MSDRDTDRFTLTAEHVRLLRAANVSWEDGEFGAPTIDPKRPYGNSDAVRDIARILGVQPDIVDDWGEGNFSEPEAERLCLIHRETETALQVVLAAGSFEPGEYEAERYTSRWRRVGA